MDSQLQFRRATELEELRQAYRLVHDVYVHQGYIQAQPSRIRLRIFEALPEMATFIAIDQGRVVGVMSVLPDSPSLGLPSNRTFAPELGQLRRAGRCVGETTNLAIDPAYRNTKVFMELSRCCTAHAEVVGLDDLFIAISPGHGLFFEEILQFDPMGELRNCGDQTVDLVVGKRLDMHRFESRLQAVDQRLNQEAFLHDWFFASNGFRFHESHDDVVRSFLNPEMLRRLLSPVAASVIYSEQQLRALHEHWGSALSRYVFAQTAVAG